MTVYDKLNQCNLVLCFDLFSSYCPQTFYVILFDGHSAYQYYYTWFAIQYFTTISAKHDIKICHIGGEKLT